MNINLTSDPNIGIFAWQFQGLLNYWVVVFLMMIGFYIVIARGNLIKTILGLNIFQTSVFLLYITMGKINGGTAPIIPPHLVASHGNAAGHGDVTTHGDAAIHGEGVSHGNSAIDEHTELATEAATMIYSNPLPSVLMLTAIVVGIATTATALALIVRIREDYGTIEEDEILQIDQAGTDGNP
ncbi:sodium:proton antiporter [Rubripirellula reticaptiva]|uniref:Putative monovalent cation/H+ antiporter subunit C n=1 Tax=Rubripirellula reticaptiva TaxID=2528013 RepID=A0A5C6EKI7_9BACT|nr:cation:proton antiporter subunit C [Rubripirellula reticaptiva]TWU48121.1 putative monovalent cation/H+ antiporter subunit C [Rubripirellula reticaptiva]